jgi:hypothetical protein
VKQKSYPIYGEFVTRRKIEAGGQYFSLCQRHKKTFLFANAAKKRNLKTFSALCFWAQFIFPKKNLPE